MSEKKYHEMYKELTVLLQSLERDSVSVDELSETLGNAYDLLEMLKSRLTEVEARVEEVISARHSKDPSPTKSE